MKKEYLINYIIAFSILIISLLILSRTFIFEFTYKTILSIDNYSSNEFEYNNLVSYIVSNNIKNWNLKKEKDEYCNIKECFINSLEKNIYNVMKNLNIESFRQYDWEVIISHTRYTKWNMNNVYIYKKSYFENVDDKNPQSSIHELNKNSESRIIEKINNDWAIINYD